MYVVCLCIKSERRRCRARFISQLTYITCFSLSLYAPSWVSSWINHNLVGVVNSSPFLLTEFLRLIVSWRLFSSDQLEIASIAIADKSVKLSKKSYIQFSNWYVYVKVIDIQLNAMTSFWCAMTQVTRTANSEGEEEELADRLCLELQCDTAKMKTHSHLLAFSFLFILESKCILLRLLTFICTYVCVWATWKRPAVAAAGRLGAFHLFLRVRSCGQQQQQRGIKLLSIFGSLPRLFLSC